jgi:hypothetical protein|tara:strand:+ start:217 stop:324 length:108 start_codon:yes stop_codon:yes gene_type:complete
MKLSFIQRIPLGLAIWIIYGLIIFANLGTDYGFRK